MTIREKYGLEFINWMNSNGTTKKICHREVVDMESELQILNFLDVRECESLVAEINNAQEGRHFERLFQADFGGPSDSVELTATNIIISEHFTIPAEDMKGLLKEWIEFNRHP